MYVEIVLISVICIWICVCTINISNLIKDNMVTSFNIITIIICIPVLCSIKYV